MSVLTLFTPSWGQVVDNCGDLPFFCGYSVGVGVKSGKEKVMKRSFVHTFSPLIHTLAELKLRVELGFRALYTQNLSGYYDYLYIHISRCEANLSLNWGKS